jgi:hypothetical protein
MSLGAVGVLAQSTPSETATSVASKASPADKAAHKAIAKATFDAEAEALGLTSAQLKDALKSGKKVSELTKLNEAAFAKALLVPLTRNLQALVGAGTIQQAQANKPIDRVKQGHVPYWNGKHHRPKK